MTVASIEIHFSLPPSLLHFLPPSPLSLSLPSLQLVVSLTAHGVILADNLVDDVKRFKVLVKDIDWLVPKVDKIYEDALSLVQSFQSMPTSTFTWSSELALELNSFKPKHMSPIP